MTHTSKRQLFAALALGALGALTLCGLSAHAQDFPTKPVRILTPFPVGSGPEGVLRLVADTIAACVASGKGVSVCGEMAGDPLFTPTLLAMGLRCFSMHPAQLGSVKQQVLRTDTRKLLPSSAARSC